MSRLRKAAKATIATQVFHWAGLLLSLATVPLYLKWLGQERYGLLLTGVAFGNYLMFSDSGLNYASMLLIAQANGREDRAAIGSILRNNFSLAACSALVVILMVGLLQWLLRSPVSLSWLPAHPEFPGLLLAIGTSVICSLAMSPFYNLLIGLQEAHLAAIYQGSGRLLGTLTAVVIAFTNAPLGWVFAGNVAGAALAGMAAAVDCRVRHAWAFTPGSFWEMAQIRQQLRTGVKSLAMQIGNVLWGTAPVLAISSGAGAQFVPLFSIPMTLLNTPLGILSSFSACLQPGYGEAIVRGETQWVADTVRRILRQVVVMLGLLGCGFLLLASPFVQLWTGGRVQLSPILLANVFGIAAVGAILTAFRYALTGINRHRRASIGDVVAGGLAMLLGVLVVREFGYQWIGLAVVGAVAVTSGWVLPVELCRALGSAAFWPPLGFWLRCAAVVGGAFGAGWLALRWSVGLADWLDILVPGSIIAGFFALLAWHWLPAETLYWRDLARRLVARAL